MYKNAFFFASLAMLLPIASLAQGDSISEAAAPKPADSIAKNKNLEEVFVFGKKKKKKINIYKTSGWPAYSNLDHGYSQLSLIGGYPKGKLVYVEFYFNTGMVNLMKKKLDINYKDVELQLLIYKVKDDSLIGESLVAADHRFTVGKDHNGAYRIDLSDYNIREERLFIGIAVTGQTKKGEANIYVRMNEKKGSIGYHRYGLNWQWLRMSDSEIFKLKMGVQEE